MNPRLVKEADALSGAGYRVSVIAADYSDWAREADREYDDRSWRIVARPRFGPSADVVTRVSELTRRATAQTLTRMFGISAPDIMRAAHHPAAPTLVAEALKVKADLYVAHRDIALPAAAQAAARHGARYAFDAEDFHLGESFAATEQTYRRGLVRSFEAPYLAGCAYRTAASPGIAEAYAAEYSIPAPVVVLNVFPRSHAPSAPTRAGQAKPGPSLYWCSQVIGPGRGLECAVLAIARAQSKPHLHLRGAADERFVASLLALAEAQGARERVHLLSPAPPSELERLASQHDIGLAAETGGTENSRILLSNKVFSYLLAGIPIALSGTPAQTALARELGNAGGLYEIDDPGALATLLDRWLLDPTLLAAAREKSWQLGQDRFNWDVERNVLLDVVAGALSHSAGKRA